VIDVNFRAAVSLGIPIAQKLRAQGHGTIVVLSSVAGERARRANFVYGASKAGLDAFYQGLADSLVGSGVQVVVVRPGFVHTRMTAGRPAAPFSTTPDKVADDIVRGVARGSVTVWSPGILRPVMSAVRHLPRPIFRKMRG
jgi:decaprenylphospho-beta-D-erythro-pentofuranosid-2-ulose 2-reductase